MTDLACKAIAYVIHLSESLRDMTRLGIGYSTYQWHTKLWNRTVRYRRTRPCRTYQTFAWKMKL